MDVKSTAKTKDVKGVALFHSLSEGPSAPSLAASFADLETTPGWPVFYQREEQRFVLLTDPPPIMVANRSIIMMGRSWKGSKHEPPTECDSSVKTSEGQSKR